ncbi:MAG TPA: EAL domain-containing protein, partial [Steroidobacteraceae bacterium]|nr:EAL domain-containing protein [Steroidobacteraceae bacterium]
DLGRLLLAEAVAEVGLRSLAYDNGTDALNAALEGDVTIALLDVDMPGMDGYEVCRRLRAEPRFVTVPIVMVTGHEDSVAITRAFEAGATDFVAKPVNWALLPRRLEYILRNAAAARALNERMVQVKTLVEALPDTLWVVTPEGQVKWSPNAAARGAEVAPPELLPTALVAIRDTAADGVQRTLEYRVGRAPGARASYELRFSRREGGDVVVVRQDTTERTAAAEHIEKLAYFDPLTELPNRQRCIETAEKLFGEATQLKECVAVLSLDLNSLKRVNDTFGHATGDAVLRAFAARLAQTIGKFAIAADRLIISRFGGDEFVIVLRHESARSLATQMARACCEAFKQPIMHRSLEFYSAPSVGLAVYPDDGPDVATVFKHADTAMYQAKAGGATGAMAAYTPSMSDRMRDWLELEGRLRRAVHHDLLSLVYQPKFRLSDNRIVGVEALLRWRDAEYGDISPHRFVEIAEDSGLILDMSGWVVRAACRQLRAWLDRGLEIPIAINCSGKELLHGDPARVIEAESKAANVPASLIEVEITESMLIKDSTTVQSALQRVRRLGCRIALDDFGTGYSSLAYITRFPPDRIKIDKAFVRDVDRSAGDAAIANAILSLGDSLRLIVTAEGVERVEQLEWLRARGCHEVQGFLLSTPLSPFELEARFFPHLEGRKLRTR